MDKNYGRGQEYDPALPVSPGTPYRPRNYSAIPAMHQVSFFLQDNLVPCWFEPVVCGIIDIRVQIDPPIVGVHVVIVELDEVGVYEVGINLE